MNEIPPYLRHALRPENIVFTWLAEQPYNQIKFYVRAQSDFETQVLQIADQLVHMLPEFIAYSGGLGQGTLDFNEDIEGRIDVRSAILMSEDPSLVRRIEFILHEASKRTTAAPRRKETAPHAM